MRLSLLLALILAATPAAHAKTYRWVDENGKVHYGDRIPPKYSKQEREVINDRGEVIERKERELTEAERKRKQAEEAAAAEAERKAAEQARYDRFLLTTYATRDQLLLRRDEQLQILNSRIRAGEKAVRASEDTLAQLQEKAGRFEQQDKPVPKKIAEQIEEFSSALSEARAAVDKMKQEREVITEDFARDLYRYDQLKRRE